MTLQTVPCQCLWLEVANQKGQVIAICKWCKKKASFDRVAWEILRVEGCAVNKPIRL